MGWKWKKDVIELMAGAFPELKLDEKTVLSWAREGRECRIEKKGPRLGFEDQSISAWKDRIEKSRVLLDRDDYLKCFKFGVLSYYHNVTKSDFNRSKQRDVGEFLTNQTQGKLGEIAIQKLLMRHGLETELDFTVSGQVASQDILRISTRRNVWNHPAVKVSIKSTKLKNVLLAVPEKEAQLSDRRSDIYILSQVGLFPNHILRLIKRYGKELFNEDFEKIPDMEDIPVKVAGWIKYDELTSRAPYSKEDQMKEFKFAMSSPNYIVRSGQLSTDWESLKRILVEGMQ